MFLLDFQKAIDILIAAIGEKQWFICFDSIGPSQDGLGFVFRINEDEYYVVNIYSGCVVKKYSDTWRNPEHMEIIKNGNRKEIC